MMLREALQWIRNNPKDFMLLTINKVFYFWWYPPKDILRQIEGAEAIKYDIVKKVYWILVLIFLVIGLYESIRDKNKYILIVLFMCLFYTSLYSIVTDGQQRFRGVIEPVLIMYVSYGLISTAQIKAHKTNILKIV